MATYRELKIEDTDNLVEIFKQPSARFDFMKFNAQSLIQDDRCNCIVAEMEGKVVGFASLIMYQVPTKGWIGRIEDVIVDENMRAKGLGRGLMEELINMGREKGACMIELTSNPTREFARKLYESLGFEIRDTGVFRLSL